MPKAKSRVLMVIPTLGRRAELLRETLQSITSQQPQAPDIVMVYPPASKDAKKLAIEFGAQSAPDPGGLTAAVNVGFALAKPHHDYLAWLGDDDLLKPGSLAVTTAALDANPKAVVAFGYCDYIDENGQKLFTSKAGSLAPWLMKWGPNLVPEPGLLFRKSAMDKVGKLDESLQYAMDLDILLRLRKLGAFVNTKQNLASFRWHRSSTTVANRQPSLDEAEQVKRRHLSKPAQAVAPLWEKPIRVATQIAAKRVSSRGQEKS